MLRPFHLALPVHDLAAARAFYGELLGCDEGRSAARWVDFDFFGHQLSVHRVDGHDAGPAGHNPVDGDAIGVPHFGAVLDPAAWRALADRLQGAGHPFVLPPRTRFADGPGEQGTFFVRDPTGHLLEFKCFGDLERLFATDPS